jgi:23S rRNA pseudoU1915 N3-methylase RlmH
MRHVPKNRTSGNSSKEEDANSEREKILQRIDNEDRMVVIGIKLKLGGSATADRMLTP